MLIAAFYVDTCSDLRGNPIEVFDVRADDLAVLNGLTSFYIDHFELTKCDSGNMTQVKEINVCVFDGEMLLIADHFQILLIDHTLFSDEEYDIRLATDTDGGNDGNGYKSTCGCQ